MSRTTNTALIYFLAISDEMRKEHLHRIIRYVQKRRTLCRSQCLCSEYANECLRTKVIYLFDMHFHLCSKSDFYTIKHVMAQRLQNITSRT